MKNYTYQNHLVNKKKLKQLLAWSFTNYDSMQACFLADELKYLGFKYATQAGISISIEDLKTPFIKNLILKKANQKIVNTEKIYLKGKITDIERFQKIITTWNFTSESLKNQIIYYFKNYDPLNSVYIMAFSGSRGNLSQVRQLVGMRGLMSDSYGKIMKLPIKKNFCEGLTVTDYLISGYGARKGIVDTALKTANSGYLTRRLINVAQDILIREKDCFTTHSILFLINKNYQKILGRILNKPIINPKTKNLIAKSNSLITTNLLNKFKHKKIQKIYIRSPLTCNLYRAICQKCYGWDLANENLIDIGAAVGILASQSIGEPGTQLTMRTFHTGGIFTAKKIQQIINPYDGIIRFYKTLKIVPLRTNRGENVFITKNSGSLILIPENKNFKLIQIEILKNTLLFIKNNQYVLKNTIIGELTNINKQIKTEIKSIISSTSGEVFIPSLKTKVNLVDNNKLIWVLLGQLYNSPKNSFINFYPDYKLNKNTYIFRTKIISHYKGITEFVTNKQDLYQQSIIMNYDGYYLYNSSFKKFTNSIVSDHYLLNLNNFKFCLTLKQKNSKLFFQIKNKNDQELGNLVTNVFETFTGGTLYYDYNNKSKFKFNKKNKDITYFNQSTSHNSKFFVSHRTIIWLGEESYNLTPLKNFLLVKNNQIISKGFQLSSNIFSKTSGIISIKKCENLNNESNNLNKDDYNLNENDYNLKEEFLKVKKEFYNSNEKKDEPVPIERLLIKSGVIYPKQTTEDIIQQLYYPGEVIFPNIEIKTLSLCNQIIEKEFNYIFIRPIELYEVSYSNFDVLNLQNNLNLQSKFKLKFNVIYTYKSNQFLQGDKNFNLVTHKLTIKFNNQLNKPFDIEFINNKKLNFVYLKVYETLNFNNHISSYLKYKNLQSSILIQKNQFIDNFTVLAYLETITFNSQEIIFFKIKKGNNKQILLISNKECLILQKSQFPNKKLNDFIIRSSNLNETGKIIGETNNFLILQKGKPYFFPNCNNNKLTNNINLKYKLIAPKCNQKQLQTNRLIFVNYFNSFKLSIINNNQKLEFSKLFLKKENKLYSSLIPLFSKTFSIKNKFSNLKFNKILSTDKLKYQKCKEEQTLLIKSSDIIKNKFNNSKNINLQLTFIKFIEQTEPINIYQKMGIFSITENFFEKEINSIFCKNTEFIEIGQIIGLLNLEKEITGDIVHGLPKIEEILEMRKKNQMLEKMLISQKPSLDPNFEFQNLGTMIEENEKINPYKLLKAYFYYYGLTKSFLCYRTKSIQYNRLVSNYEGSYRSFKKVQLFILQSVQAIYKSQDVIINDKHLEVIIKQMTTKIIITSQGKTPLLIKEIVDLYHTNYINQIMSTQNKEPAYYIPLLLGITRAALNNPSFISAASFQETARVLANAAIEGRIDWLRGLKENIIIGHLIPAGTGSPNYQNCFKINSSFN